jgi:glucose-1-phosphate cytidylyltransferase
MNSNIPVVILAGGLGTRLHEETQFRPKPMVPIGGKPILWHIMKNFSHFGFSNFIICLGYKGDMIKEYFLKQKFNNIDFTINTKTGKIIEENEKKEEWQVTLVDTGKETQTGSRIAQVKKYINADQFIVTYGDGISNVNIQNLVSFHKKNKKLATLTAVQPPVQFGHLSLEGDKVKSFQEKKKFTQDWINGGFCILNKEAFNLFSEDKSCVFEKDVLPLLAQQGDLGAYKHDGFWYCMDTIRDKEHLESLWKNNAPWKVWQDDTNYYPAQSIKHSAEFVL